MVGLSETLRPEGASLAILTAPGETVSAIGKGTKAGVHLIRGENTEAAIEGGMILLQGTTNSPTNKAVKSSVASGTITNATEEAITDGVLSGLSSFVNKIGNWLTGKINSGNDEKPKDN